MCAKSVKKSWVVTAYMLDRAGPRPGMDEPGTWKLRLLYWNLESWEGMICFFCEGNVAASMVHTAVLEVLSELRLVLATPCSR